jgi:hypothetical protein
VEALNALIDRLASDFPDVPMAEVRQVTTASWSMFADRQAAHQDDEVRVAVTEWYARRRLADRS